MVNEPTYRIPDSALDQIFRGARTFGAWEERKIAPELLKEVFDLLKLAPTSANSSPARFVFVTSPEAKARLLPAMAPGNVEKTKTAPVTVLVAYDTEFHEQLPRLFPQADMKSYFVGKPELIEETAFRSSSLEAAYLILAARALGLDCGPMSGFDAAKVNKEFFPDDKWKINLICNLGYGDRSKLHPRNPRLSFEEACKVL
ncbi:MAG: malonic semialdehyde reductase [Acidobacteriota bacterium]|nr:malonic semialdehyde reductase [Acidobacteriota bacterium]